MQPDALARQCADSISAYTQMGVDTKHAIVALILPKGWRAPPKFPRRTLLSDVGGQRIYGLSAMNVLAWLAANGLVRVEAGRQEAAHER